MVENSIKGNFKDLLQKLVHDVYFTAITGLKEKTLMPDLHPFIKWRVTEFEYGDNGITKFSGEGKEFLKPLWHRATSAIEEKVKGLSIYNDTLTNMLRLHELEEPQAKQFLSSLISRVAWDTLEGKIKNLSDLTPYSLSFLKDLDKEEQEYRAEVQLRGLVLQPNSILLDENISLRKPTREDFEIEESLGPASRTQPLEHPTAFLHVRVFSRGVNALQHEIDRAVAVLQLFRVGAVQDIKYTVDADSITDTIGRATLTRGRLLGPDKYLITQENVEPLRMFWSKMKEVTLPESVYAGAQKEPDELAIAYERYSDSLEGGVTEKRISSAVMGLEALYLSPTEQQEMSYRLRMRAGKLLSLIGYNPSEVRKNMAHAYDVRSIYVHGGILKGRKRSKLEKECGDLNQFSKTIMDYLRASIVALLTKRPGKASLIQKIDDSFLGITKEIKELVSWWQEEEPNT